MPDYNRNSSGGRNRNHQRNRGNQNRGSNTQSEVKTRFPVPFELQGKEKQLLGSNFALDFQKYLVWKKDRKGKWECKDYEDFEKFNFNEKEISSILTKQKSSLKIYAETNGLGIEFLELENDYRLTCGLGSSSVWAETGMTLHHIYGFPFIPGSSLKGLVRMVCEKTLGETEASRLFGSQESSSLVDFFDAFPMESPTIKADIMNPHYGDYYSKKESPGDWLNPVPVNFLTVQGGKFRFPFVCKNSNDVERVKKLLLKGLEDYGIGGKTKVGYGYFS